MERHTNWIGPFAAIAAAVALGCSGPSQSLNMPDTGSVDAGPCGCSVNGEPCDPLRPCCGNLMCQGGLCAPTAPPQCAGLGELCSRDVPCCAPANPLKGGGAVTVGCRPIDAGIGYCYIGGRSGSSCGSGWGCANGLSCVGGTCSPPYTGKQCPSNRPNQECIPGDNCFTYLQNTGLDPCNAWGLVCVGVPSLRTFACRAPAVEPPPFFPLVASSRGQGYSVCDPMQDKCVAYPGDPAPAFCGQFFPAGQPTPVNVCVEACDAGSDCGNPAWDCVKLAAFGAGQCLPNYCYAHLDGQGFDVARELTTRQGYPVSSDVGVLYHPCARGSRDTVCLPYYDDAWSTVVGICYRVGGAGSGGPGASCNPTLSTTDPAGMCASGSFCMKGTCLPWCDVGGLVRCPTGQTCTAVQGALVSTVVSQFGVGVCADTCDPYQDASNNGCTPAACGVFPPKVCKPTPTDGDQFPAPGLCVGGRGNATALDQPCDPNAWQDACASGSICARSSDGVTFTCAQVCDPKPGPGVTEPACPSSKTCKPLGPPDCINDLNSAIGYVCNNKGVCR